MHLSYWNWHIQIKVLKCSNQHSWLAESPGDFSETVLSQRVNKRTQMNI